MGQVFFCWRCSFNSNQIFCLHISTLNGVCVLSFRDFISPQMASMPKCSCNGGTLHDVRGIALVNSFRLNSLPYNCFYFVTMTSIHHNYYRRFQSLLSSSIYAATQSYKGSSYIVSDIKESRYIHNKTDTVQHRPAGSYLSS